MCQILLWKHPQRFVAIHDYTQAVHESGEQPGEEHGEEPGESAEGGGEEYAEGDGEEPQEEPGEEPGESAEGGGGKHEEEDGDEPQEEHGKYAEGDGEEPAKGPRERGEERGEEHGEEPAQLADDLDDKHTVYCLEVDEQGLEAQQEVVMKWQSCCNESVELVGIPPGAGEPLSLFGGF